MEASGIETPEFEIVAELSQVETVTPVKGVVTDAMINPAENYKIKGTRLFLVRWCGEQWVWIDRPGRKDPLVPMANVVSLFPVLGDAQADAPLPPSPTRTPPPASPSSGGTPPGALARGGGVQAATTRTRTTEEASQGTGHATRNVKSLTSLKHDPRNPAVEFERLKRHAANKEKAKRRQSSIEERRRQREETQPPAPLVLDDDGSADYEDDYGYVGDEAHTMAQETTQGTNGGNGQDFTDALLFKPITTDLGFTPTQTTIMAKAGVTVFGHLAMRTKKELASLEGFGRGTMDKIEDVLREHGLSFAG